MNLLPKDHKEFASKDYWNNFFLKQKSQHFEWYGEYDSLSDIFDKYIRLKEKVLIIGCGNSKLSANLYDVGICNSTSIDISEPVIKQMKERYGKDRPKMEFKIMDVFNLKFANEEFSVLIDKGTLDALFVDESKEVGEKINRMFSEMSRVLRPGGRYLCFSLLQEHVLQKLLDWFPSQGWLLRFHRCMQAESRHEDSLSFPIYAIVCTKMKLMKDSPMVLEIVYDLNSAPKRCSAAAEVIDYVTNAQHYAFLKHYLSKKKAVKDDICLELCSLEKGLMRYKMFVVDRHKESALKFAIFIVPQGRETEWLFSTAKGRQELASSANCERLIVVHLMRDIVYGSLEDVKGELGPKVMELAPAELKSQVPILSLGDDVGQRYVKCRDKSSVSGEYIVEDVLCENNEMFRRLVFLNSPYLIQSEVKIIPSPIKKKNRGRQIKYQIDHDYLACHHHSAMVMGFSFIESDFLNPKILLVGLGGGILPVYLHKQFSQCTIDVVELDSAMLEVGKNWFGLVCDERLKVYIDDGIRFISKAVVKGSKYNAVILDVDNKDSSLGISSPPVSFLENNVLEDLQKITSDIVIMNFACRNSDLREDVLVKLKSTFRCMFTQKIANEVNEVLYCNNSENSDNLLDRAKETYAKTLSYFKTSSSTIDFLETDFNRCVLKIS